MSIIKKLYKLIVYFILFTFFFLVASNIWMVNATKERIYSSLENVPRNDVALVLGTSKQLTNGEANPFFTDRIDAAEKLFKSGKVKHLILSGDHENRYYNEPQFMKDALLKKGIPDSVITLDDAGLRTLDSVVRCREIFGQEKFTIITQQFHSYRAVYISEYFGMDANAFSAKDLPLSESYQVVLREFLARTKAILDLYVLDMEPKVMGKKEKIEI